MNVSVTPLVSEMHVPSGQTGRTSTQVTNDGDADERISIEPVDWTTNQNGAIQLERPGSEGAHSLTKYLQALSYRFILRPHETRRVEVALTMPPSQAAESYWGGFIIKSQPLGGNLAIGPAATFFVYDDVGSPRRHVSVASVHQVRVAGTRSVRMTVRLYNDGSAYARTAGTLVISKDGKTVSEQRLAIGAILPGHARLVTSVISGLPSGTYAARVVFDYGGEVIVGADTSVAIP